MIRMRGFSALAIGIGICATFCVRAEADDLHARINAAPIEEIVTIPASQEVLTDRGPLLEIVAQNVAPESVVRVRHNPVDPAFFRPPSAASPHWEPGGWIADDPTGESEYPK